MPQEGILSCDSSQAPRLPSVLPGRLKGKYLSPRPNVTDRHGLDPYRGLFDKGSSLPSLLLQRMSALRNSKS